MGGSDNKEQDVGTKGWDTKQLYTYTSKNIPPQLEREDLSWGLIKRS